MERKPTLFGHWMCLHYPIRILPTKSVGLRFRFLAKSFAICSERILAIGARSVVPA